MAYRRTVLRYGPSARFARSVPTQDERWRVVLSAKSAPGRVGTVPCRVEALARRCPARRAAFLAARESAARAAPAGARPVRWAGPAHREMAEVVALFQLSSAFERLRQAKGCWLQRVA